MRILYGVAGEGMGHAIRSKPIIEHLLKNHEVMILSSGNAYNFLKKQFPNAHKVTGFHLCYKNNAVAEIKTFFTHFKKVPGFLRNFKYVNAYRPEVVITDFESFSYLIGKLKRVPIISIDNIHSLT